MCVCLFVYTYINILFVIIVPTQNIPKQLKHMQRLNFRCSRISVKVI